MNRKICKISMLLVVLFFAQILYCNQEIAEILSYLFLMVYCIYKWSEVIILCDKLKKFACVEWWIYVVAINLAMNKESVNTENRGMILFVFITLIMLAIRMLVTYIRADTLRTKIQNAGLCILLYIYLALILINNEIVFWVFKLLTMLILIDIVKYVSAKKKDNNINKTIIIICCAYIFFVIINAVLNSNFLLSTIDGWEYKFYFAVQSSYALPSVADFANVKELWGTLINFILFRIIDAVIIGGLIDAFTRK